MVECVWMQLWQQQRIPSFDFVMCSPSVRHVRRAQRVPKRGRCLFAPRTIRVLPHDLRRGEICLEQFQRPDRTKRSKYQIQLQVLTPSVTGRSRIVRMTSKRNKMLMWLWSMRKRRTRIRKSQELSTGPKLLCLTIALSTRKHPFWWWMICFAPGRDDWTPKRGGSIVSFWKKNSTCTMTLKGSATMRLKHTWWYGGTPQKRWRASVRTIGRKWWNVKIIDGCKIFWVSRFLAGRHGLQLLTFPRNTDYEQNNWNEFQVNGAERMMELRHMETSTTRQKSDWIQRWIYIQLLREFRNGLLRPSKQFIWTHFVLLLFMIGRSWWVIFIRNFWIHQCRTRRRRGAIYPLRSRLVTVRWLSPIDNRLLWTETAIFHSVCTRQPFQNVLQKLRRPCLRRIRYSLFVLGTIPQQSKSHQLWFEPLIGRLDDPWFMQHTNPEKQHPGIPHDGHLHEIRQLKRHVIQNAM